jgi:micrococcal nuclease
VNWLLAAALVFVSASDGDTLVVRDGNVKTVLRLAEIDAPERMQPYSQVAWRNLTALCKDKPIEFTLVTIDRFGRTVAHVRCDGVHVNWRQVQDGLAWCFHKYLTQPGVCLPLEREARDAKRGLWRDAESVAPWTFRASMQAPTGERP